MADVAQLTAVYAKGWKSGFSSTAVFWVKPDQVSKEANTGEFIGKGSFMVRGERNYLHPAMELYVGKSKKGVCIVGSKDAVLSQLESSSSPIIRVIQGGGKPSDVAKKIASALGLSDIDEIVRNLPASDVAIAKTL